MMSVRRAALIWMTLLLTLVGLVGAAAAYMVDLWQANGLLDRQLLQIALNAGPGLNGAWPSAATRQDIQDTVVVQIWNAGGERIYSNGQTIEIPRMAAAGFDSQSADGERWRSYRSPQGGLTVQVSQRIGVRTALARTAALEAAVPILVTIPLGWLVIGWGIQRILGPLAVVAAGVAARGADTRHPIPVADVPLEVMPLVEAMNLLIGRLQTSIEQQKRFVSDAAHELRTPLAALRLQIDNLSSGRDQEALDSALSDLGRGADRAAALVDQLLRLARYESAGHTADERPVDVVALIIDCLADHFQIAEAKQVDLGIVASDPALIQGNEKELKILFGNLIQNAVRYTPSGGIVDIAVRLRNGRVAVEIADSGCGIPPDLLPRVFDRFFRAAPPDVEGTGLGLSICKAIAARNGLTITLANRAGGGLMATVTGTSHPAAAASPEGSGPSASLAGRVSETA